MPDYLKHWTSELGWLDPQYSWVLQVVIVLLLSAFAHLLVTRVMHHLQVQATKTALLWDDALIAAARRPLVLLVWVVGLVTGLEVAGTQGGIELLASVGLVRKLALVFTLTWFVVRFVAGIEGLLVTPAAGRAAMDTTTVRALGRLTRLAVLVLAFLVVLQNLGISISGVLAFGGIGGLAVGFAAKDLLANFFGGLMIYLDRPFKVGDWIRSPDQNIEGVVEDIGWRQTRIRTFSKRPLYVPNATFTHISVENPSRMSNRRIYEYIGVRYGDAGQVAAIIESVRLMLSGHPDIDTEQILIVNLDRFGPSSLDFFIYAFTKTTDWVAYHSIKQDVMIRIMTIIEAEGAEFAFPTTTVHLAEVAPEASPVKAG
ncbi:MAG: mechanosensitive ion channel family protein [Pontibacterium sp.]